MTISDDLTQGEIRKLYGCYNTNKQTKAKIDALMEAMAKEEATLGIDSTQKERETVKKKAERDNDDLDVNKKVFDSSEEKSV